MKPAYVSVVYKGIDNEITLEGWMTLSDTEFRGVHITPSIDYDKDIVKIAIPSHVIVSITPAESIRAYRVDPRALMSTRNFYGTWNENADLKEVALNE